MRRLIVTVATAVAALMLFAGGQAAADTPAVFDVGAGTANINPDTPQYPAGYGYKTGPFSTVHDPLEARAFVVGEGSNAVALVSADLCGWFAAYHGDALAPYGIDATRDRIADLLNANGYSGITRAQVIISSTHTHAAPSVVGIWGTIDKNYLKKVADGAVASVQAAIDNRKPSQIWTGTGSIRSLIWQNGQGTDHVDGFGVDDRLPIMWARDPKSGATNALYANVPVHPDEFNGKANLEFSADWDGYVRKALDEMNGGTSVIAAGTLGRQETPGSVNDYTEVVHQGDYIVNQIQHTMAKATPLTDDTVAGTETRISTPADNDDLLLGIKLFAPPSGACIDAFERCTIPRSAEAPYMTGTTGDQSIGTTVVGLRIGDVSYSTNPGEAFPEVNDAIRNSISGDRQANVVAQAGDMLGYYYQRSDYTDQQFGSSDFEDYNVGPDLGQDNADAARENAAALGFQTTPETVHAAFNSDVADRPGVQFYSDQNESADPTRSIYGPATKSQDGTVPEPATVDWNFGDGTSATTNSGDRFDHTFPGPGKYKVKAKVTGSNGKTRSWTDKIKVDTPLEIGATVTARSKTGASMLVTPVGGTGQGRIVSATWQCGGSTLRGVEVVCPGKQAGSVTVTGVDGAGNTATATASYPAAPKLKVKSAKLRPRKLKAGKKAKLIVRVRNKGGSTATGIKVCAKVPKKAKKGIKTRPHCRKPGSIKAGRTKKVKIRVKATRKAKRKTVVRVKVHSKNAGKAKSRVKVRTRR